MPTIHLIGFRGTGYRDSRYQDEPALIKAGHIGIRLEGDDVIYGFHPTEEAVQAAGGEEAITRLLKAHVPQEGTLFDDTAIFKRAYQIAQTNPRTAVWQAPISLSEEQYHEAQSRLKQWYTEGETFLYDFPPLEGAMPEHEDNCATFPRKLGLPIPEDTGNLRFYLRELTALPDAQVWQPKGAS